MQGFLIYIPMNALKYSVGWVRKYSMQGHSVQICIVKAEEGKERFPITMKT